MHSYSLWDQGTLASLKSAYELILLNRCGQAGNSYWWLADRLDTLLKEFECRNTNNRMMSRPRFTQVSKLTEYGLTPEDKTEARLGRGCLALERMKSNTTSDIKKIKKTNGREVDTRKWKENWEQKLFFFCLRDLIFSTEKSEKLKARKQQRTSVKQLFLKKKSIKLINLKQDWQKIRRKDTNYQCQK